LISTPGKRKRCTAKRATSSSVRRGADRQALEILRLVEELAKPLAVALRDLDQLGDRVDRLVQVLHPSTA
jgi:hypothetical protein